MKRLTDHLARASSALLLSMFCSLGTWAQSEVITVGTGTRSSSYVPLYPNNNYSLSQQIYTSEEIGRAGQITSIAFYNYDTGSERNCDIYLSHTTKQSFDSSSDWVTVAESDKVYSGTVNLSSGWTVIDFDTPFQYDGSQNLLLTVDDNTGKDTGYNYGIGSSDASGNQALYYYKMFGTPVNLDPTQPITEEGTVYYRKNNIKLCFETYPKPYRLEAVEIGDESALIQCSLRGDATAWNLRYRKVAGEGEEEQRWTTPETLTDRSYTIEGLTPATKYEVQVQAVFPEEDLSDWTESLVFTTNCCPIEQQANLIFALRSNYSSWYGFAVQIIDVTDEDNPIEAAYLHAPSYELYGGTVTLCCGHKYSVNWIYDADHANVNNAFSFALYLEPGDLVYSMAMGEAPEATAELTTFIMDCGNYCAAAPSNLSVASTTFNSATLSFMSETKGGEVVYSTTPDFDPRTATPASVTFEEVIAGNDPWGGVVDNAELTLVGLEPLTEYYVRLRSVCDDGGVSRWSKPVKVTTGSLFDAPSQVTAQPMNSRTEKLSWQGRGSEKAFNIFYRPLATGNPVSQDDIQTFGSGNGKGFENGSWGDGIWSSYSGDRPSSNTLFVGRVPAGSSFSFKAGQGKTGAGKTQFTYGLVKQEAGMTAKQTAEKFDKECLNDADRAAIIKALKDKKIDLEYQLADLENKHETGEISDEDYLQQKETLEGQIDAYNSEIETLESMPTDAMKLERMRELEQSIKDYPASLSSLEQAYSSGQMSEEEYKTEKTVLEAQHEIDLSNLEKLRVQMYAAENPEKNGFSITKDSQSPAQVRGSRAPEDETYVFFIRHANDNGYLLVKDITITSPDQLGEWTVIKNISATEYALSGLEPATTYEVMVEPIYDGGLTGSRSPITVFTTIGAESDPAKGAFAVGKNKNICFARGNLRYSGDIYGYGQSWSMASQQYAILGEDNVRTSGQSSYPATFHDLLCWSTTKSNYGIYNYYYEYDEDALPYFQGDFVDWGESPSLISDLGTGWRTLTKDEWNYLLNERKDAQQLRMIAKVAGVKGLLILPDGWSAPDGILLGDEIANKQWADIEETGAVFLPAAGQMTSTYDGDTWTTTTLFTEGGTYWTATPAGDKSDLRAFVLTITDTDATLDADMHRRTATAVRLVKDADIDTAIKELTGKPASIVKSGWYTIDGRKLGGKPAMRGLYIFNGKKYVVK